MSLQVGVDVQSQRSIRSRYIIAVLPTKHLFGHDRP
jgi:hypothetical protein